MDWKSDLVQSIRNIGALLQFVGLDSRSLWNEENREFPTLVSRHYASLIHPKDPQDPLLRQVLATESETCIVPGFGADPVGDAEAQCSDGILWKYAGRVLILPTGSCAMHCRHCFRRAYPYRGIHSRGLQKRLQNFLENESSVAEVILSGGDPLLMDDAPLADLLVMLAEIPHVRRLRIHTRLPVALPSRFSSDLFDALDLFPRTKVLVSQVNHAQELDLQSARVFAELASHGFTLLNQSVLLQGVNDSVKALAELSEKLADQRVVPYYLHQLDRAQGAAHFEVPVRRGRRIHEALTRCLPGYLVPRYVREKPGEPYKTRLA